MQTRWRLEHRSTLLAISFSGPVEPVCLPPLRTLSLLPHSASSVLVPVQSLYFSVNVIGNLGMMKGRITSKAGQWS